MVREETFPSVSIAERTPAQDIFKNVGVTTHLVNKDILTTVGGHNETKSFHCVKPVRSMIRGKNQETEGKQAIAECFVCSCNAGKPRE